VVTKLENESYTCCAGDEIPMPPINPSLSWPVYTGEEILVTTGILTFPCTVGGGKWRKGAALCGERSEKVHINRNVN